ncbi:ribbon-helix-helix domain-containing protein [Shinella sp.]|uniref:ribbon-helix-helix domain-containing protein n=1 Tax=Shinella sp. TaxID=1870904 RepID=UPI00403660D9
MTSQTVVPKKKRGPPATGKGTQIQVRLHDDLLSTIDDFVASQPDAPSRSEAIRRILRENLIDDPDALINELYKTSEPGIGAAFMRAINNHLRSFANSNPEASVDEFKEFVLDLFNDYGQDLQEFAEKAKR